MTDTSFLTGPFDNLAHARVLSTSWRRDYNHHRPHSALDGQTPAEFATMGVSLLLGYGWSTVPDGIGGITYVAPDDYFDFLDRAPTARAGYSINIYHIVERTDSMWKSP